MKSNATKSDGLAAVQTALANIKRKTGAVSLPVTSERKLNLRPKNTLNIVTVIFIFI